MPSLPLAVLSATLLQAAARPPPAPPPLLKIEVQEAELSGVLRLISATSGQSYVLREEDDCTLTLRLVDVHWTEALHAVLAVCRLQAVPVADTAVVRIAPLE